MKLPSGGHTIDSYPEKDQYIPEAAAEADKLVPDSAGGAGAAKWNLAFHAAMNRILAAEGLRVL